MLLPIRPRNLFMIFSSGGETQVRGELDGPAPFVVAGDASEGGAFSNLYDGNGYYVGCHGSDGQRFTLVTLIPHIPLNNMFYRVRLYN